MTQSGLTLGAGATAVQAQHDDGRWSRRLGEKEASSDAVNLDELRREGQQGPRYSRGRRNRLGHRWVEPASSPPARADWGGSERFGATLTPEAGGCGPRVEAVPKPKARPGSPPDTRARRGAEAGPTNHGSTWERSGSARPQPGQSELERPDPSTRRVGTPSGGAGEPHFPCSSDCFGGTGRSARWPVEPARGGPFSARVRGRTRR